MIITPHLVHFCTYRPNFNIYLCVSFTLSQVFFIYWLCKFLRFFNTSVTVLGDTFNTRPVSRVPAPFIAISTIFSFVPGRQALFLYSNWNVLWLHTLFRHRYLCLPVVLFFPYNETSSLPQYGHFIFISAIGFTSCFFSYFITSLSLCSTVLRHYPLLHLAVHMAFVCSLRAGEVAGIRIDSIDFRDRSMWITQIVQRVSDKSLQELPKEEIIKVFPKKLATSTSSLILKGPKTEGSRRKQYLTTPLLQEIKRRLETINANKEFLGPEYHDYGLLFCLPDGTPLDPKSLDKSFKERQTALHIEDQIEFQGLRKSGQMHKIRLSQNNYQLVAENSGQSPEVLMSNYNEALESEKRTLSLLVETSFYPNAAPASDAPVAVAQMDALLQQLQHDPALTQLLLQKLLSNALGAS